MLMFGQKKMLPISHLWRKRWKLVSSNWQANMLKSMNILNNNLP